MQYGTVYALWYHKSARAHSSDEKSASHIALVQLPSTWASILHCCDDILFGRWQTVTCIREKARKSWSAKPCSRLVKPVIVQSIGPATEGSLSGAGFDLGMFTCSHIKLHKIQYKKNKQDSRVSSSWPQALVNTGQVAKTNRDSKGYNPSQDSSVAHVFVLFIQHKQHTHFLYIISNTNLFISIHIMLPISFILRSNLFSDFPVIFLNCIHI